MENLENQEQQTGLKALLEKDIEIKRKRTKQFHDELRKNLSKGRQKLNLIESSNINITEDEFKELLRLQSQFNSFLDVLEKVNKIKNN